MPGDHIQRGMTDLGFVKLPGPFDSDGGGGIAVFKRSNRRFEITSVGQTIRTDRPARWQVKFLPVILTDEPPAGPFKHDNPVHQSPRQDRNLLGFQIDHAKFCTKPQATFLGDD